MVIRILDHVATASTYDDGEVIYRLIKQALSQGEFVSVSFDGINAVPSAFVNSALVRLLEGDISFAEIRGRLQIVDSTKFINDLVRSRFGFASGASKH